MARDVREGEVTGAEELDRRPLEEAVVLLADKARVLNRLVTDVVDVCLGADDANVVWVGLEGIQGNVCEMSKSVRCSADAKPSAPSDNSRCPIRARIPMRER